MGIELKENEVFGEDGMIYCTKCCDVKSVRLPNGEIVRANCRCKEEENKEDAIAKKKYFNQNKYEKLRDSSLLGKRFFNCRFEDTSPSEGNEQIYKRCRNYCLNAKDVLEKGYGIYLYGNVGTGKSHLTACMSNDLMAQGYSVLFTNFITIGKKIKDTYGKTDTSELEFIDKITNIDFLFVDDIGTEVVQNSESWIQEKIYDVVNGRYNNLKPTIFTSNLSLSELHNKHNIAPATISRINAMSNAIMCMKGEDRRLMNIKKLPF